MKRLILSALFVACQTAAANAQNCLWPTEKAAFEIVTLKNTLMVAALSCQRTDEYNDFVLRFQPFMQSQQSVVDRYFSRIGGAAGRAQEDGFMTQLSNDESQQGLTMGVQYCAGAAALFNEVLSVADQVALTAIAAQNAPENGGPLMCAGRPAPPAPLAPPPPPVGLEQERQASLRAAQPTIVASSDNQAGALPAPPPPPPHIISGWTAPAMVSATPLPGNAPVSRSVARKTSHYAAAPVKRAKPAAKPVITVVQI